MNIFGNSRKRYSVLRAVVVVAIAIVYAVFHDSFRIERLGSIEREEAESARQALGDAVATNRAEIIELWNEARNVGSKMPRPRDD